MKNLIKTTLILFITNFAVAQSLEFGVKGSLNLSNVTKFELANTVIGNTKVLPSGAGAVFLEVPIGEGFSVRPEVGYAKRGTKVKNIDLNRFVNLDGIPGALLKNGLKGELNLEYIDVPLMLKYKFGDSDFGNAYVMGGPTLSFMVNNDIKVRALGLKYDLPFDFNYNKTDIGGQLGAGYEIPFKGKVKLFAEAAYRFGFTDFVKDVSGLKFKSKNNNLNISAGLSFPI